MKTAIRFLKTMLGLGTLDDVCWFSEHFWDVHDYPIEKGGDGSACQFHKDKRHSGGKEFGI